MKHYRRTLSREHFVESRIQGRTSSLGHQTLLPLMAAASELACTRQFSRFVRATTAMRFSPDSTSHLVASRITALADGGGRGGATRGWCCHLSQTGRTCGNAGNAARLRLLWTREPIQSAAEFSPICECENIFVLSLSVGLIQ